MRKSFHKIPIFFNYVFLQGHMTNYMRYISITTRLMSIKLDGEYNELLRIKAHNRLNSWSQKATWQIKYVAKPKQKVTWQFEEVIMWSNMKE